MDDGSTPDAPCIVVGDRAFVVEFDADADLQAGRVIGRVEHVVSGRATSFQSHETLLAFMAQVLREVRGDSTQMSLQETI